MRTELLICRKPLEAGQFTEQKIKFLQVHMQTRRDARTAPPHVHTHAPSSGFVDPSLPSALLFMSSEWVEFTFSLGAAFVSERGLRRWWLWPVSRAAPSWVTAPMPPILLLCREPDSCLTWLGTASLQDSRPGLMAIAPEHQLDSNKSQSARNLTLDEHTSTHLPMWETLKTTF